MFKKRFFFVSFCGLSLATVVNLACAPTVGKDESVFKMSVDETLNVGDVPLGESVTDTIIIVNQGDKDFAVLSATLLGGQSGVWLAEKGENSELSKGDLLEVSVIFTPSEVGVNEDTLEIRTTIEESAVVLVELTGEGTLSEVDADGDGWTPADGDCDDGDSNVFPGANEACDGKDSDCDGTIPEDEADEDRDGYRICDDDCNDSDAAMRPGATEICDQKDNDCDGILGEFLDLDNDGYDICDGDCDDEDQNAYPNNPEICDEIDNNCSGVADDVDNDGDGFGPCTAGGDCDDYNAAAHPVILDPDADGNGDGSVEFPYNNINSAIAGMDGICRTVAIFPGTYQLSRSWDSGTLKLNGLGSSPSQVVIEVGNDEDGNPLSGRIFDVSNGAILRLANLTLRGGNATGDGGAIRVVGANLELDNTRIVNSTSSTDGGAVSATASTLTFRKAFFQGNNAGDDGGAVAISSGTFIDRESTYQNNRGSKGGALLLESVQVEFSDLTLQGNNALEIGGGIYYTGTTTFQLQRGAVWGNSAGLYGGGIAMIGARNTDSYIQNIRFQDNYTGNQGYGAAIALTGAESAVLISNNTFAANDCDDEGSGVYIEPEDATGTYVWANVFYANKGDSVIYSTLQNSASIAHNTAFLNTAAEELVWNVYTTELEGQNHIRDPFVVAFSADGDPSNDDLSLQSISEEIDAGPSDGEAGFQWNDSNGTPNDRGHTGGPGAQ